MDQNPYESPREAIERPATRIKGPRNPPGWFEVVASFFVILSSGTVSEVILPLDMPYWADVAGWLGIMIVGLWIVWWVPYIAARAN